MHNLPNARLLHAFLPLHRCHYCQIHWNTCVSSSACSYPFCVYPFYLSLMISPWLCVCGRWYYSIKACSLYIWEFVVSELGWYAVNITLCLLQCRESCCLLFFVCAIWAQKALTGGFLVHGDTPTPFVYSLWLWCTHTHRVITIILCYT